MSMPQFEQSISRPRNRPRWDGKLRRYVAVLEDLDGDVLKDGESVRVPMYLMDSVQKSIHDSLGGRSNQPVEPGIRSSPRQLTDAERARDERGARLRDAWKQPPDFAQDCIDAEGYASSRSSYASQDASRDHAPDPEAAWRERGERDRSAWKRG